MAGLFLGIDVGTGGVRASAIDARGEIQGMESTALPLPRQDGNAIDQEPELWWQATFAAIGRLGTRIDLASVERISVDGTSGTLFLVDADGRPLTPGLMYNDARASAEAGRIAAVAPAESGAHGASSALAKLLHLLNEDSARGARFAVHQADWIAGRLAGHHGVSDENNALKLGYDPVTRTWPAWLDRLAAPRDLLPKVLVPGTAFAEIDVPQAASACRHRRGSPPAPLMASPPSSPPAPTRRAMPSPRLAPRWWPAAGDATDLCREPGRLFARLGERWLRGGAQHRRRAAGPFQRRRHGVPDAAIATGGADRSRLLSAGKPGERFPIADPAMPPHALHRDQRRTIASSRRC